MRREQRLEAMGMADALALVMLADRVLETLPVEVTRGPAVGLLMVQVEEPSQRLPFNFTEVTVSEAEVAAAGQRGYAMVMGTSPEKALAAAVLDVAVECEHPLTASIEALLDAANSRDQAQWQARWAAIAPTLVNFEDVTE